MTTYDVYATNADGEATHRIMAGVSLQTAAEAIGVDDDDIEWAIEEEGRCDTDDGIVVEHGDPAPTDDDA
jgi:hypothetical protein